MDDSRIVDLYLSRDESAISQTSEKYGSRLRNVAYGIVEDLHTAEECENDTYMEAWNSIPPHEPRSYLFAFLARITRHIALDFCSGAGISSGNTLIRRGMIYERARDAGSN